MPSLQKLTPEQRSLESWGKGQCASPSPTLQIAVLMRKTWDCSLHDEEDFNSTCTPLRLHNALPRKAEVVSESPMQSLAYPRMKLKPSSRLLSHLPTSASSVRNFQLLTDVH